MLKKKAKPRLLPGKKLDEKIARDVLGWRFRSSYYGQPVWFDKQEGVKKRMIHGDNLPEFSRSIRDAWDLLAELKKMSICSRLSQYHNGEWFCEMATEDDYSVMASGGTAPHVICLAALEAVKELV